MEQSIDTVLQKNKSSPVPHQQLSRRSNNQDLRQSTAGERASTSASVSSETRSKPLHSMSYSRERDERHERSRSPLGRSHRVRDDFIEEEDETSSSSHTTMTSPRSNTSGNHTIMDFFSQEVFQLVIHNPTTAYRFLRFCQIRNCGEPMEFLQKVDRYNRLLDDVTQTLSTIHSTFITREAPRQIELSSKLVRRLSQDIKQSTHVTLPALEDIFAGAQQQTESLLAQSIYPRFVKHQVTASASMALAQSRDRFAGLGDCFCLTNPSMADNPIVFASDGFVSVTGYERRDIIPRNCRFLQGPMTDPLSTTRLRNSIQNCEESVELLLNYRKNGEPFWNLLYCSPLFSETGEVKFFLGGQINCSTTIHSRTDILKVLSTNDDEIERMDELERERSRPVSAASRGGSTRELSVKSSFFKSWRKYKVNNNGVRIQVRDEAGIEPELIDRMGKLSFSTQVEAFYTAYSKYIVLNYHPALQSLTIKHYSPGIIDMLCLNLPNGAIVPIFNKDIFKVLAEHSATSSSAAKAFKEKVRAELSRGNAVSMEIGLLTGYEERKQTSFRIGGSSGEKKLVKVEERYVCHWTPLKDGEGRVQWVVLTIAPVV